jgi:hypothetical protein
MMRLCSVGSAGGTRTHESENERTRRAQLLNGKAMLLQYRLLFV